MAEIGRRFSLDNASIDPKLKNRIFSADGDDHIGDWDGECIDDLIKEIDRIEERQDPNYSSLPHSYNIPEDLKKEIKAHLIKCDVTNIKSVTNLFNKTDKIIGAPNLVIYNPTKSLGGNIIDLDPKKAKVERSVPKKVYKDAMLAWEMNGVPLPNAHGGPLRMVTPGYFGINNVKHLGQVAFTKTESTVKYMKSSYRISPIGKKGSQYPSCWEMTVKSWITRPTDETGTAKAGNVQIVGVAMGGTKKVRSVKVSINGGQNWKKAKFVGPDLGKYAWRQFVFEANLAPGSYNLASKASAGGKTQPELRYENRRGYAHNGWKDHSVNIKVV